MYQNAQQTATQVENQMDEGGHAVNVSAATINQSNQVTRFLQIVTVSVQRGRIRLTTYAFLFSGSIVSFIDQSVNGQLQTKGTDITFNIAGIHGTQESRREVSYHNKGTTFKDAFN